MFSTRLQPVADARVPRVPDQGSPAVRRSERVAAVRRCVRWSTDASQCQCARFNASWTHFPDPVVARNSVPRSRPSRAAWWVLPGSSFPLDGSGTAGLRSGGGCPRRGSVARLPRRQVGQQRPEVHRRCLSKRHLTVPPLSVEQSRVVHTVVPVLAAIPVDGTPGVYDVRRRRTDRPPQLPVHHTKFNGFPTRTSRPAAGWEKVYVGP
jgi:hypothetical protein